MGDLVRSCNFDSYPVQSLGRHANGGTILIVENDRSLKATRFRRTMKSNDTVPAKAFESVYRFLFHRSLLGWTSTNRNCTLTSKVRECSCSQISTQDVYCPIEKNSCNACGLSADGSIASFTISTPSKFLQNCWPIVMMWEIIVLLFIFFTEQGRKARRYILACFCNKRSNTQLLDESLDRHRVHRRRSSSRIGHGSGEDNNSDVPTLDELPSDEDEVRRPQRLTLRTKRYCRPYDTVDDEDADNCSICFVALRSGDRVGALPCQHSFHVDCLKLWIRRKNSCPLCQIPNVATLLRNDSISPPHLSHRRDRLRSSTEVTRDHAPGRSLGQPFAGRVILNRIRR
jgi:hypothetical protein